VLSAPLTRFSGRVLEKGPGNTSPIDYRLAVPKWQSLSHAAERGFVLHGSGLPNILQIRGVDPEYFPKPGFPSY
jgi:hypothetical protein